MKKRRQKGGLKKEKLKKEKDILRDALHDLERELKVLRASRRQLEAKIGELGTSLGITQMQEIKLRDRISALMKKESALVKKKAFLKDRVGEVAQKIEKVKSIERDLQEV